MKITFPHIGKIYIFVKALLDSLNVQYIVPPHCSKKTIEIGSKYAPEMVCLPLKINLGNFIESIELGADTVIITGANGPCRFGYYGELHREILKSLGYDVKVIILDNSNGMKELYKNLSVVFNTDNPARIASAFLKAFRVIYAVDRLDELCRKVRPREKNKGETDKIMNAFTREIDKARGSNNLLRIIRDTQKKIREVPLISGFEPLKVGLVGDIYTLIEPFSNIDIERRLGNMGVEVDKSLTITKWINEHLFFRKKNGDREFNEACADYLPVPIGGHGRESVGNSVLYSKKGYDGVIQIYPLTCMPEIVAESILPSVSEDHDIPILTLIIDEMTGEAGYATRLDAFTDILMKRRETRI